uniref:G-protein coupled receptors family 1 profile domain-containing protein n=1 Tax=Ascaris lumbricoides TaxID=6252 RepID=A0A9J2P1V9_ASCLU
MLAGFSTFIGGLYRLCIISLGLVENQFTPFQCMLLPHSFLWRWSDFATSFMLLVLSLDRLISILLPIQYVTWGPAYAAFMIFTADQRRRAQLRMTVTVAFSSCSTLFFDAIPRAVGVYGTITAMNARNVECESLMSHLFHLTKLNSMINLVLYYIRSKAMRASIRRVCGYKDDIITLNRVTANSAHQKTPMRAKEVMLLWPDMNQE